MVTASCNIVFMNDKYYVKTGGMTMEKLIDRFLKYVKIDTHSCFDAGTYPSTGSQHEFAQILAEDLKEIGLVDVDVSKYAYVTATLPSNIDHPSPVIGFIAHMDTSPEMASENVNPRIIKNYDGKDIVLNEEKQIVLHAEKYPSLSECIGHDIIVTDGTTLLGADDKAGIAEIITAMEYLIAHPDIKHGKIRICFTPDEEVGGGTDYFDVEGFGADFAYTLDGDAMGTLEYECFNGATATITINGVNIHPGSAKGKMLNSILIASELNGMLPPAETPAHTEGYEGFYHLNDISGDVEKTVMKYIIRDHDLEKFNAKKDRLAAIAEYLNKKYGDGTVELKVEDTYYNMKEKLLPDNRHVIDLALEAITQCGITPVIKPIRGGTDGARLTYMGLPTPNLFVGGGNYHGRYEYASANAMAKAVEVIMKICELAAR